MIDYKTKQCLDIAISDAFIYQAAIVGILKCKRIVSTLLTKPRELIKCSYITMAREGVSNISRLTHDHIKSNGRTLDHLKLNAMHCILFYEATQTKNQVIVSSTLCFFLLMPSFAYNLPDIASLRQVLDMDT